MYEDYFVIDIETCPFDMEKYNSLEEEERNKLLNPIESKIVAIGIRYKDEDIIIFEENEKDILIKFWEKWKEIKNENPANIAVGFNVLSFDIPFIVAKSFIHNVEITPFPLKTILDVREKINAYRYGKTKGRLSDYGKLMGLELMNIDGSDVAKVCEEKNWDLLKEYLKKDLEVTEKIFKRLKETNIININKW